VQKIREAERDKQYEVYKDRIGEIINGQVKRVEYGNVVVDLGGSGPARRWCAATIDPREMFRPGDRIRASSTTCVARRGAADLPVRTHPQFTAKLFAQEVPEIYDGIVEVKSVARDPVRAPRSRSSPTIPRSIRSGRAWACAARACRRSSTNCRARRSTSFLVGRRGDVHRQRVAAGEVMKVVLDEDSTRIEVVVPDDQLSLASAARAERAAGLAAYGLGHRHPHRGEESNGGKRNSSSAPARS